jgi:hypothetical protein
MTGLARSQFSVRGLARDLMSATYPGQPDFLLHFSASPPSLAVTLLSNSQV